MSFQKIFKKIVGAGFVLTVASCAVVTAQTNKSPKPALVVEQEKQLPVAVGNNLYCAGYVQTAPVNTSKKIVGAENEQEKYAYARNNNLYVSMGANSGVKVGDMFSVVRPRGPVKTKWSKKGDLGFLVQEVGMVEVVKVKNDVSVVRVKSSCEDILLGDLLEPMETRTSPEFSQRPALDTLGDASGKARGRIFMARDGREMLGREQIVYIDLGADSNVQVGDYLTIFRPLGKGNLDINNTDDGPVDARERGYESNKYHGGVFSNQAGRKQGETATGKVESAKASKMNRPSNLRKVVGEMVILNVKEKTATAVIVRTAQEIHTGDMVEVQ